MSFPGLMCKVAAIDNQPLMVVPAKEKQKNNQPSTINPRQSTSMGNISGPLALLRLWSYIDSLRLTWWSSLFSNRDGDSKGKNNQPSMVDAPPFWMQSRRLRFVSMHEVATFVFDEKKSKET